MGSLISVARQLESEVPGLKVHIEPESDGQYFIGRYDCPCGEISSIGYFIAPWEEPPAYLADLMKEQLRRHVRSEGNEPNF